MEPESEYKPFVLSNRVWPERLDECETHWFLRSIKTGEILDPTEGQFEGEKIPYDKGIPNGMMNYPKGGSKRAKEIIHRLSNFQ